MAATKTTRSKKTQAKVEEPTSLADLLGMDPYVPPVEDEVKSTKLSPFDFINAITYTKEQLIVDESTENQYQPFIVNRGLANSNDTVFYVNEMNARPYIDKRAQFLFLMKTVTKRKRYDKWVKPEVIEDLEIVKEYYGCNTKRAETALSILTTEQLDYIKAKLHKGGTS